VISDGIAFNEGVLIKGVVNAIDWLVPEKSRTLHVDVDHVIIVEFCAD
jgi:hypothetical protein